MNPTALALYLAANIHAIAADENAGQIYNDISNLVDAIERMINRPHPAKVLGPCPTSTGHHQECATHLTAPHGATEVICPTCQHTHNVKELSERLFQQMHYRSFTIRELLDVVLPRLEEWVPRSTLYHWVAKSRLIPTSYNVDGDPMYLLADVRELRSKSQTKRAA